MKNWKNAELIELDINETANGYWDTLHEHAPYTQIGVWFLGSNDSLAQQGGETEPGQQPSSEGELPGTPSTEMNS